MSRRELLLNVAPLIPILIPNQPVITDITKLEMGSISGVKVNPLQRWHDQHFGVGRFLVNGNKTDSKVPNTPIGFEETLAGMINRLRVIMVKPGAYGYFSVESGLIRDDQTQRWEDVAVLGGIVGGQKFIGISPGVYVPDHYVKLVQESGQEKTWGDIYYAEQVQAGQDPDTLDRQDPQRSITKGEMPRSKQLEKLFDMTLRSLIPLVYPHI